MELSARTARTSIVSSTIDSSCVLRGGSSHMAGTRNLLAKVAAANCNVLITGETGTGKELAAGLIHSQSRRRQSRLVCLNCAAVPDSLMESELFGFERGAFTGAYQRNEGRISEANGGTLFLDEIGEMTLAAQSKILRCLETRELQRLGQRGSVSVDVRIVAATNQNLEEMVSAGKFRKDLYYRLNVARVELLPLRSHRQDIPELANYFLSQISRDMERPPTGFDTEAMRALMEYEYPGNVRELRNIVEVSLIHDPYPQVGPEHLPECIRACGVSSVDDRTRILNILRVTKWNKSEAAKQLHWSRMTLYRKMARYSIADKPDSSLRSA